MALARVQQFLIKCSKTTGSGRRWLRLLFVSRAEHGATNLHRTSCVLLHRFTCTAMQQQYKLFYCILLYCTCTRTFRKIVSCVLFEWLLRILCCSNGPHLSIGGVNIIVAIFSTCKHKAHRLHYKIQLVWL